jgi:cyclophilin family peptidyl-prolyl cis-trans isomerase
MSQNKIIGIVVVVIIVILIALVSGITFLANIFMINKSTSNIDNSNSQYNNDVENKSNIKDNPTMPTSQNSNFPKEIIPADKDYKVRLETSEGTIVLELTKDTPYTTGNFVTLAKKGFYDGVIFHRVIEGFMIQGGDPTGTGSGGPGYKFNDEKFNGEYKRGVIAMANAGPNTNGSQFFIMHKDNQLPKNYVIFGKVVEGIEVVDKIATTKTTIGTDGAYSKPITPIKILKVTVG